VSIRLSSCILMMMVLTVHSHSLIAQDPVANAVSLRLAFPEPSVCMTQFEMKLELFLTNGDSQDLDLTEKGFGTGITYFSLYDSAKGSYRGEVSSTVGDWLPALNQADMTKLNPGQSIHTSMTIPLPRKLFDRAGFYKIQIRYSGHSRDGHGENRAVEVLSNWAIVEMEKCGDKPPLSQ
jgi:hypothetical protein